jgi:hypothetical protein
MDSMQQLVNIVEKASPLLATAIASANPIAGVLIGLIANVFGVRKNNLDGIVNSITNDPMASVKLKQIEYEHQDSLYNSEVQDRVSARGREEAIIASGKRDWLMDFIALVVVCGYFIMCKLVVFNKIDTDNQQVLYMMYGQLTGGFIMVLSYYFGSSKKQ